MATLPIMTVLFCTGVAILYFVAMPDRGQRVSLARLSSTSSGQQTSLGERLQTALRAAGMFHQAPSLFIVTILALTGVAALLLALITGHVLAALAAPPFVFLSVQLYLYRRQRNYTAKAIEELVPFLNRISSAVKGGMPISTAYLQAVEDSGVLKNSLGESAAKIAAGEAFVPALLETLPKLPLRMWSTFVRQVELYVETGGDMAEGLDRTVEQITEMIQLQAEARADYAVQSQQAKVIILILIAAMAAFGLVVDGGEDRIRLLIGSPAGIAGLLLGLGIILGGLWGLNKQIRDIERKLNF